MERTKTVSGIERPTLIDAFAVLKGVATWVLSGPASAGLAILTAASFGLTVGSGHQAIAPYVSAGFGHPWWTVFSSLFWVKDPLQLLLDVTALLSVGIMTERLVGSLRYLGVGLASCWLGTLSALGLTRAMVAVFPAWGELLEQQSIAGSGVMLVGAVMAVSVRLPGRSRRRIQATVASLLLALFGFAATLNALAALGAALAGWAIGSAVWGKPKDDPPLRGRRREGRALIALVVAGVVVGVLASLSSPSSVGALSSLRYDFVSHELSAQNVAALCELEGLEGQCAHYTYLLRSSGWGSATLVLMPLVMQLVLAWGLSAGRRAAMWGTVALQATTALVAVFHLIRLRALVRSWSEAATLLGFTQSGAPTARFMVPIIVPLVLILLVAGSRQLFTVHAAPGTYRDFWRLFLTAVGVAITIAVVLGIIFRGTLSWVQAALITAVDFLIRLLPSSMLSIVSPQAVLENRAMMIILEWTPIFPWLVAIGGLLWSFSRRALPGAISQDQYTHLVRTTDAGSFGWCGPRPGNLYWGSAEHESGVAYRVSAGVALTVSDPAARQEDLMPTLKEFTDFCAQQDLIPAFYSVHRAVTEVTDKWDWPKLQIGEETLVLLGELESEVKEFRPGITGISGTAQESIQPEWATWAQCPKSCRRKIKEISKQCDRETPRPEDGLFQALPELLDDPEAQLLLAVTESGDLHGVSSWMPIYEDEKVVGWTLSFLRCPNADLCSVGHMIAEAALWAGGQGCQVLSLADAPMPPEPTRHFGVERAPVYLTIPDVALLPSFGLAALHARPAFSLIDPSGSTDPHKKKHQGGSK